MAGVRPAGPTLFIDQCAWSAKLGAALDAAGIPYIALRDRFPSETEDDVWLAAVRHQGWLVVTRDKNIRYKINEQRALIAAGLVAFVYTQGGLSAAETATILVKAYAEMSRVAAATRPPAMFSLTRSGEVRRLKLGR